MNKTIVIADDNRLIRLALAHQLSRKGYHVQLFENGQEALLFVERNSCDLLITDIQMPILDGIGLVRKIRSTPDKKFPVIVMSSSLEHISLAQTLFSENNFFFNKPLVYDKLLTCIHSIFMA